MRILKKIGWSALVIFALAGVVFSLVGMFNAFAWGTYSAGLRTGLVQEISYTGFWCKTYEGKMILGDGQNVNPKYFSFTVKDPAIVQKLVAVQGRVATLGYVKHIHTSGCWGNTVVEITDVGIQQ